MLERIGKTAYCLDLAASKRQVLLHNIVGLGLSLCNIFHIGLLRCYWSNELDYEASPVKIDGKE